MVLGQQGRTLGFGSRAAPALMEHHVTPQAIILRCQPSRTREIYTKFKEDRPGLLWTPLITRTVRLPRRRKKVQTVNAAIPGYLFLLEKEEGLKSALDVLARLKARPLWMAGTGYARCPISALEMLRDAVQGVEKRLSKPDQDPVVPVFSPGSPVKVAAGHYWMAGLRGTVVKQHGEEVAIQSTDFWGTIKISCWLLEPDRL